MLAVRGAPGTHDVNLGVELIERLKGDGDVTALPLLDKAVDDRKPPDQWPVFAGRPAVIIVEGWCLGAEAVPSAELEPAINTLEKQQDAQGVWRNYVNEQLRRVYPRLFSLCDVWVMLAAPDWNLVYGWRLRQETRLRDKCREQGFDDSALMSPEAVATFIQHYERITRRCLEQIPARADFLLSLDEQLQIVRISGIDEE